MSKCQQPRRHYLQKKLKLTFFFFLQKRPALIFSKVMSLGVKSIRCVFISEALSVNVQAGERSRTATSHETSSRAANTRSTQLLRLN